jgi:hypothetical protein
MIERYARAWIPDTNTGYEISLGVEYRHGENVSGLAESLKEIGQDSLNLSGFKAIAEFGEKLLRARWPDRAYFIEVDDGTCGVQIFAPYGLPQWR